MPISRVVIVHGYGGSSALHWQTWLARKCRAAGLEVAYPKLPHKYRPLPGEWLSALGRAAGNLDGRTALEFLDPFYAGLDAVNAGKKARACVVFASDDDAWVDLGGARALAKKLNAPLHVIKKGGHLSVKAGFHTFPQVLGLILQSAAT